MVSFGESFTPNCLSNKVFGKSKIELNSKSTVSFGESSTPDYLPQDVLGDSKIDIILELMVTKTSSTSDIESNQI